MIKGHRTQSQNESIRFSTSSINLKSFFTTGSLSKRGKTTKGSMTNAIQADLHISSASTTSRSPERSLHNASPTPHVPLAPHYQAPQHQIRCSRSTSMQCANRPVPLARSSAALKDSVLDKGIEQQHKIRKRTSYTPEHFFVSSQQSLDQDTSSQIQQSVEMHQVHRDSAGEQATLAYDRSLERTKLRTRLVEEQELTRQLSQRVGFDAEEIASLRKEKNALLASLRQYESELVYLGARCASLSAQLEVKTTISREALPSTPDHGHSAFEDFETPILGTQFEAAISPLWYGTPRDALSSCLSMEKSPVSTHTDSAFDEHEDAQGQGHPFLGCKTFLSQADEAFLAASI